MTDREKLIEVLLRGCRETADKNAVPLCSEEYCKENREECFGDLINLLLANGVVVREWIPVTERLPEVGADILVCHKNGFVATNAWLGTHWWFKDDKNTITHWMPLPEPPKEGE